MSESNLREQRAHERYYVKEGAFVVIKKRQDSKLTVGQIIDISSGGLALKYMSNGELTNDNNKLDIYFTGKGLQLKDISFKLICDFGLESSFPFSSVFMRRGCVQFKYLENEHKSQLSNFIKKYTNIEKN